MYGLCSSLQGEGRTDVAFSTAADAKAVLAAAKAMKEPLVLPADTLPPTGIKGQPVFTICF